MPSLVEVVTFLFVATNACRLLAYFPQMIAAAKCQNGATAVSRTTWSYFAVAHAAGVVYSRLVLHDSKMAAVLLGNFLACGTLVAIVTWKKARHRTLAACRVARVAEPELRGSGA